MHYTYIKIINIVNFKRNSSTNLKKKKKTLIKNNLSKNSRNLKEVSLFILNYFIYYNFGFDKTYFYTMCIYHLTFFFYHLIYHSIIIIYIW